jgi:hypothetical protein
MYACSTAELAHNPGPISSQINSISGAEQADGLV